MATTKTIKVARNADVIVPDSIAIELDRVKKRDWSSYRGTEVDLVRKACAVSGYTPETLARRALQTEASRIVSSWENGLTGRGIAGSSDAKLRLAYNALVKEGRGKITPTVLCAKAELPGSYRTAKAWLERRGLLEPATKNANKSRKDS